MRIALSCLFAVLSLASGAAAQATAQTPTRTASLNLGLLWAPNHGQWSDEVLAASVGGRSPVCLTRSGLVVGLGTESGPLRMSFPVPVGTSRGQDAGPSVAWLGACAAGTKSATASTSRELMVPVLPGIGLVLREGKGGLRYDVQVAPGADLEALTLGVSEATSLTTEGGCLVMRGSFGEVRQTRPVAWQLAADGSREPVACRFHVVDPGEQPPVAFGTYVGFDGGSAGVDVVHTDAVGRLHVAGGTSRDQLVRGGKNKGLRGFPVRDNGSGLLMETARDSTDGFYMILDPQQATFDQALIYSSRIGTDGFNNAMVDFDIGPGGKLYFLLRASDPMPTTSTAVASSPFFPSGDSRNTWIGVFPSRQEIALRVNRQ